MTKSRGLEYLKSSRLVALAMFTICGTIATADELDELFYAEAVEPLFEMAQPRAHEGDARAQMYLGAVYWDTRFTGYDPSLSMMWLQISYANGHQEAAQYIEQLRPYFIDSQIKRVLQAAAHCIDTDYAECLP